MSEIIARAPVQLPRELVLASAGTGKTFRISSRIIGLLASGSPADAIFASTFTRKAAGEILDRVLGRLALAALSEAEARKLSENAFFEGRVEPPTFWLGVLQQVVRDLHRVNIGTLDSFFVRTVRSFADEIGLPPTWRIADNSSARMVREEALREVLDHTDRPGLIEMLRGLARGGIQRSVHDAVLSDLENLVHLHHALEESTKECWGGLASLAPEIPEDFKQQCRELADDFDAVAVPQTRSGSPRVNWSKNLARASEALRTGDWDLLLKLKLCASAREEGGRFDGIDIPEEVTALFARADELARIVVARSLAEQCRTMGELTAMFAAAMDRNQRASGAFGFGDLTRLLGGADPLCDRADLYYRLDARTQHILLDEFQDTSLPQWEALEPLVAELLSGYEGERAAVIVADPKQSIYAWRGGEPALVSHVGEQYGLTSDRLPRNWRSSQIVLDLVNKVFADLPANPIFADDPVGRRAAEQWSEAFQPHEAANDLPGSVQVLVGPEDEGRGPKRRLMARAAELAGQIRREAPRSTIGILTRKNVTVARIMLELRRLGIPASEEGGNPLTDSGAVASVLALFRLADHPGDRLSRYHVAKTPVGPVVAFTDHTDRTAAQELAHRFRRQLIAEGYGNTVAGLASKLENACDARERRRLNQLVELAFRYDPDATLRLSDFVRRVEMERVEDPTAAAVRVMTVHQAKGLEFDAVILPELDEPLTRPRSQPIAFRRAPTERISRIFPHVSSHIRPLLGDIPELEAAVEQAASAEIRDALSGLYVAMTRARHATYVLVKPDGRNGMGKAKTAARLLRHALDADGQAVEGEMLHQAGDSGWFERIKKPAEAGARPERTRPEQIERVEFRTSTRRTRALPRVTPSELAGGPRVDLKSVLRLDLQGAERGTIVHAWFEQVGWLEDGLPGDGELVRIARGIAAIAPADLEALISRFRNAVRAPQIAHALSRSSYPEDTKLERETPFIYRAEDRVVEGIIDRLVLRRENGKVMGAKIIDYKTDRISAGDPAALRNKAAFYAPQMDAYRVAVAANWAIQPSAVTASFLFLHIGAVVEANS